MLLKYISALTTVSGGHNFSRSSDQAFLTIIPIVLHGYGGLIFPHPCFSAYSLLSWYLVVVTLFQLVNATGAPHLGETKAIHRLMATVATGTWHVSFNVRYKAERGVQYFPTSIPTLPVFPQRAAR